MLDDNLVLKHNELYLVGEKQTDLSHERATGLYARDTRFLDHWELGINGLPLEPLETRVLGPDRAIVIAGNSMLPPDGPSIQEAVLPLTVSVAQHVTLGVDMRVRVVLGNYSGRDLPLTLSLELGGDFRDMFDIRGFPHPLRDGGYLPPTQTARGLSLGHIDRHGDTTLLQVEFSRSPSDVIDVVPSGSGPPEQLALLPGLDRASAAQTPARPPRCQARFPVMLAPGESWDLLVRLKPVPPSGTPLAETEAANPDDPDRRTARVVVDNPDLQRVVDRAMDDLAMLQTTFPHGRITAAGIPWFVAPFGRDSIIVALQTLHLAPHRAVETLRTLAALQGEKVDLFREEEPGKILHEMRYGEMARRGQIPHTPYYGSVDSTPLFVMLCAETIRWTGNAALYQELLPHVKRAMDWIEEWGDRDRDGFVEYAARLADGVHIVHQGWKDSHDSLHQPDGQPILGSIALVEVQGYVYAAYQGMAEIAALFGDAGWAAALRERATTLQRQVEAQFWLPREEFYAQALDGQKQPVAAIASNAGHLLFCGLPSPERAAKVAQRLLQADFHSGWGIRTLAFNMRGYNPMSYHNGSVWPHDNSLIGAGLAHYGEIHGLERTASAIFSVARRLPDHRLPELYCGFPRDEDVADDAPVPYPVSCSPQAWAAGAIPLLMRAMLGLAADPERGQIRVSPTLPEWLPRVRIEGIQALGNTFDLEVAREGDEYRIMTDGPVVTR